MGLCICFQKEMNRRSILPQHSGYNVFNPITIDVDGPFGLAVCQPSTVPRPFIGVKTSVDSSKMPQQGIYSPCINELTSDLHGLDELEEIYAECGAACTASVTSPETSYASRKMSTMPRPFASVHCHSPNSVRRSFSVDMHHSHSFANTNMGPPRIIESCRNSVRTPCSIRCNSVNQCGGPSYIMTNSIGSSSIRSRRQKPKKIKRCCCMFGSHVATMIFTLFSVAVAFLVLQIIARYYHLGISNGGVNVKTMSSTRWEDKSLNPSPLPVQTLVNNATTMMPSNTMRNRKPVTSKKIQHRRHRESLPKQNEITYDTTT